LDDWSIFSGDDKHIATLGECMEQYRGAHLEGGTIRLGEGPREGLRGTEIKVARCSHSGIP
jgi:hypothetical protein